MAQEIGQFHQLAGILTQIIQGKSVSQEVRSHVQARDLGSTRQGYVGLKVGARDGEIIR
jgi:hypothetical protein